MGHAAGAVVICTHNQLGKASWDLIQSRLVYNTDDDHLGRALIVPQQGFMVWASIC